MKEMDFSDWLGVRRCHSCSYGNDEQQRQAGKDSLSCTCISEPQCQPLQNNRRMV
jgi:hypothetical protein